MREPSRSIPFGDGAVLVSEAGSVVAVRHPDGVRPMLLEEDGDGVEAAMHDAAHRWGTGFVITDRGSARFDHPAELTWTDSDTGWGVDLVHRLGPVDLAVSRRIGESWTETYALRNVTAEPVRLGSVAVSTPWRDVYGSAADSLRRAVHAHVWTGGADSWVWAAPMDGSGPGLGLVLTEGELWAYSVESRNPVTGSNVRGHLYLHVTDISRAPHAMGGQPDLVLAPGEECRWAWRLDWYGSLADLHADREPPVEADALATEVGQVLTLRPAPDVELSAPAALRRSTPGVRQVYATRDGRRSRISVLFHPPLRALVEARVRFALDRQRQPELADSRRFAFVPYDVVSGLTVRAGGWVDWSDARERVGTAVLLQEVRRRGWGDRDELDAALAGYARFVVEHVVAPDGTVAGGRLYDHPWFARFLLEEGDVDRAVAIMDRYYALGGDRFLAFELGAVLGDLTDRLAADGRTADAARMRGHLLGHARRMPDAGKDLPAHEVNYEQSMVAPLLDLLLAARARDPDAVPAAELDRRLRWLEAFAADQPDVRLRHVPIRHWDGYWFGALRLWGDVFPHYWSVLSAAVYLTWPDDLPDPAADPDRTARLRTAGRAILRANLAGFAADGSATCAFVYPSCVDGRPAHVADPLANDQDWALVYALRFGLE